MGKYRDDAEKLLEYVGGKENIAAVTHCATRMRFVLNDQSKANEKAIEDIPSVKGMFTNAGQFQVIIGNDVPTFYNDFTAVSGIEGVSKEQSKAIAKNNQNIVQRAIGTLAEIFTPLLPAIIVGGLMLGLRNFLEGVPLEALGGQTITQSSTFWNGVNGFLWLPCEAIFHFLPVGITWSIARKMGATQILGIVLGITLVSPQLLNAYSVSSTSAAEIAQNYTWDFGFFTIDKIGYQAQVIPAMLAGFLLVYLERFFRKWIPEAVSMIFVPLFSLLPTILAAHMVLGPIGWQIGSGISWVVNAGLTSSLNWLFGFIFGGLYAPLVITGLHHTTLAIDSQLVADYGTTNLWPMIMLSNIAQGTAVLAIWFLHRGNKKEEQVSVPATISAYMGVTEPAMFGINLKYVYPFLAAMVGSAFGGMLITATNTRALGIGVGGLPGFLSFQIKDYPMVFLSMGVTIVVTFIFTFIFRKVSVLNKLEPELALADTGVTDTATTVDPMTSSANAATTVTEEMLYAPADGQIIAIGEVEDPVFSQKMMGDGYAVRPSNGKIYAPVAGTVSSIFETKHAIGILTPGGAEVLVHMGLDTVELKGAPFTVKVSEGDAVTVDTLIAEMDLEAVTKAGKKTDVVTVLTNAEKINQLTINKTGSVHAHDRVGAAEVR
ncbi:PTS system trehalose-specific EIIBC component [Enterococcus gallinarum]|uniref:PTS system sucrose-specific EIIBCA component n=1 Tax=Enterococcus gallinarum TaxID=1353 RepID=A0ABD4HLW1_ENTGA|nr:PTS system trehalose-specific EIIBC component [Enterococcus gallinarum]MBA0948156.1 PTS system trehalose-specific EIIBC component [Enterococcus gallinarum]MBA0961040.1 PTS system trehalose-specific EIIBC component [Enterococcus gallinarum]MBA0969065.1 PTS system trehalose-specific EIIBC component [Enterococcus gallinarum]MBA0972376.1 PTS system trehalose-specific EIIBC component [Enterococcus gallinarum]MCR1932736.1 PTS system trehalose-specific EIIBC component [Enterococcus gallinarum]